MRQKKSRQGFTLLEVLAAVAILAIWFLVIVGTSIQGVRAEGVSRRRLEAGLIADRELSQIQTSLIEGTVPPVNRDEFEEGDFLVTVAITPFLTENAPQQSDALAPGLEPLLARNLPERGQDLYRLDIEVGWMEAGTENKVERTSFLFDLETAVAAYEEAGIAEPNDIPIDPNASESSEASEEAQE